MDQIVTDERVEDWVIEALDSLPEPFRERLGSVAIVVAEEPTREELDEVGAHGLFGLYQGVPRTRYGADASPFASKITIFSGPLRRTHGDPEALARAVRDTVLHEVAHHFGIDDARIRELRRDR